MSDVRDSDGIERLIKDAAKSASETIADEAKRVGGIVDDTRKAYQKDYSGSAAAVGSVVMVGSLAAAFFGLASSAVIAGVITGGVIVLGALTLHYFSQQSRFSCVRTFVEFEAERTRNLQRAKVLEHVWLYGLPAGVTLREVQQMFGLSTAYIDPPKTTDSGLETNSGNSTVIPYRPPPSASA